MSMDCHVLRVMDFDTPISKNTGGDNSTLTQHRCKSKKHQSAATAHLDCNITKLEELGGGDQNATTCTAAPKILNLMKRRSGRGLFRNSSQTKSKKHTRRNTPGPENLEKSHKDDEYSNRRSRFNLFFNRESNLHFRSKGNDVRRRSKKRDESNIELGREIHNSTTRSRKPVKKQGLENNRFRSPDQIFGLHINNQSAYPCLNQLSCDFLNVDNHTAFRRLKRCFGRKSCQKEKHCKQSSDDSISEQHQFKVLNLRPVNYKPQDHVETYHYRNYSEHTKNKTQPIERSYNRDNWRRERRDNFKKDVHVLVSASSLAPINKCRVDEGCGPSGNKLTPEENCRLPTPLTCDYVQPLKNKPSRTCQPCTVDKSEISKQKSSGNIKLGSASPSERRKMVSGLVDSITCIKNVPKGTSVKCYIKYVSLGLLIVVCSPCLLVGFLAWILKCPLQTNMLSENPSKNLLLNKVKKKGLENVCQREHLDYSCSQRSVVSSFASLFARAVDTTTTSLNAMLSLLKSSRNKQPMRGKHRNSESICYLHYMNDKAWAARPAPYRNTYENMRCAFTSAPESTDELPPCPCPSKQGQMSQKASISRDCMLRPKASDNVSASRCVGPTFVKRDKANQCECPEQMATQQPSPEQCSSKTAREQTSPKQSFGTLPCNEYTPVPTPNENHQAGEICMKQICEKKKLSWCEKNMPHRAKKKRKKVCKRCKKKQKRKLKKERKRKEEKGEYKVICMMDKDRKKRLAKERKRKKKERNRNKKAMKKIARAARKQCKKLAKARKKQEKMRRKQQKALKKKQKKIEKRNKKLLEKCKKEMEKKLKKEKNYVKMKKTTNDKNRILKKLKNKRTKRANKEKKKTLKEERKDLKNELKIMKQKMKLNKRMRDINKMKRKYEKKKKKVIREEKIERNKFNRMGYLRRCWAEMVAFEKNAFPKISCDAKFIHTLRNRPCIWIYRVCPKVYPCFLHCYSAQANLARMIVYLLTFLIWAPIMYCCNCCICMILYSCGC